MDYPPIDVITNGLNRTLFCPRVTVFEGPSGNRYSDRYSDASATWVVAASILIFFMKTGFLFIEIAFVSDNQYARPRVVLAKYLDTCASGVAFYLFGFAVSGESGNRDGGVLGESEDFILWFFRFTFASNTATILHGTLVGEPRKLRMIALFIYAFLVSAFIHPVTARFLWSPVGPFSPYRFCNGTLDRDNGTYQFIDSYPGPNDNIVFFDFAGAGVVHMLGGFGGLVLALICRYDTKKDEEKKMEKERNRYRDFQVSQGVQLQDGDQLQTSVKRSKRRSKIPSERSSGASLPSATVQGSGDSFSTNINNTTPLLATPSVAYLPADDMTATGNIAIRPLAISPDSESDDSEDEEDFLDEMYPKMPRGENTEMAALGVLILWMTFFAFNCGTVESITGKVHHSIVGRIALNMVVSGCFGGLCGVVIAVFAQLRSRSTSINTNEMANCILGSLVAITGVCPYIDAPRAIVVGVGATVFYHFGVLIEYRAGIKDTARVFPVHGMCGLWGLLSVGILGQSNLIRQTYENICHCLQIRLPDSIDSQGYLILYQLAAIGLIAAWSVATCCFVFFILRAIPMQGLARLVDLLLVDFLDYYIFSCFKSRRKRYERRKRNQERARMQYEQNKTGIAQAIDVSKEEQFVYDGGMLLTGQEEYGTQLGRGAA